MAPKIKPIRRDSNDVSAMLMPCRLELLMKPSTSSVITDSLVSEDRFIAENYLQGNVISKSTFMHHLHNSILNSRTDTSKCCVHASYKISQEIFDHKDVPPTFETAVLNSSNTNSLFAICREFYLSRNFKVLGL